MDLPGAPPTRCDWADPLPAGMDSPDPLRAAPDGRPTRRQSPALVPPAGLPVRAHRRPPRAVPPRIPRGGSPPAAPPPPAPLK